MVGRFQDIQDSAGLHTSGKHNKSRGSILIILQFVMVGEISVEFVGCPCARKFRGVSGRLELQHHILWSLVQIGHVRSSNKASKVLEGRRHKDEGVPEGRGYEG